MPKFAWVMGLRGPEPQILHDDSVFGVTGEKKDKYIQVHDITVMEAQFGVRFLMIHYPYGGDIETS